MLEKIKKSLLRIIMFLSVFSFASAAEYNYTGQYDGDIDEFLGQYSFYSDTTFQNYLNYILSECSFYHMFSQSIYGYPSYRGCVYFSSIDGVGFNTRSYGENYINVSEYIVDNAYYPGIGRVSKQKFDSVSSVSYSELGFISDSDFYLLVFNSDSYSIIKFSGTLCGSSFILRSVGFPTVIGGFQSFTTITGNSYWGNSDTSFYYLNGIGEACCGGTDYGGTLFKGTIQPAVEDNRLQLYTLKGKNGDNNLIVDLSAFRGNYTPAASKDFSEITLILDCDGSEIVYVIPVSFSDVVDSWNYSNNVYSVSTPYTYFDLKSYDNVKVVNCSFSLTTSSPGGSSTENFNIVCEYYLKRTASSLEPDDIELPEFNDVEIKTEQEILDMKSDLHEQSSKFSFLNGTWNFIAEQDLPVFPGWANVYTNYVWFADGNSDTTYRGKWFQMANNIPSIADLSRSFDPAAWIENNLAWSYYDVVLLKVYTVNVGFSDPLAVIDNYSLAGYLVFISDRYYDHYQIENQLDLFKLIQFNAANDLMFYDYLKSKLDDFESKTLSGLGFIDSDLKTNNSWLQTINSGIGSLEDSVLEVGFSIVSAINNIPSPDPFDDSIIINAVNNGFSGLTSRLNYLLVPSFSWKSTNYDDYLDSLGVLSAPFRFGSAAFDGLENNYSSNFEFHIDAINVPLPSGSTFKLMDSQEVDFNIVEAGLPSSLWSALQNFFFWICVLGQAYYTYSHIFRKGGEELDI